MKVKGHDAPLLHVCINIVAVASHVTDKCDCFEVVVVANDSVSFH